MGHLTRSRVWQVIGGIVSCAAAAASVEAQRPDSSGSARVLVSAREVRVYFPRDTSRVWGWPADTVADWVVRYHWGLDIDGFDGRRTLGLRVGRGNSPARTFSRLQDLVAAGEAGLCAGGLFESCDPLGVSASAEGDQVVLVFRGDARSMRRLFGLRPDVIGMDYPTVRGPGYQGSRTVAVQYVDPQIPMPDSAYRAEAARAERAREKGRRWMMRNISDGGLPTNDEITVRIGGSTAIDISTMSCSGDICSASSSSPPDAIWTVDDTTIARLKVVPSVNRSGYVFGDPRVLLIGVANGRTTVRVRLSPSPIDTLFRKPPARELEREIVVRPP